MIEFSRAQFTHFAAHFVGNKGLGEDLIMSDTTMEFSDDFVKETTLKYFLMPFKTDVYHQFKGKIDVSLNSVANLCEDLFRSQKLFINISKQLASILYDQSMHPKIAGGSFYVCYFKDVVCDGELLDAIGIFKTEKQTTFLKMLQNSEELVEFSMEADSGIDIDSLDKGCLIFNTNKSEGYKLSIIDSNNKVAECSLYWQEDFLNAKIKPNDYYHTKNLYDASRTFLEESEIVRAMPEVARMGIRNKLLNYLSEKDMVVIQDLEREVFVQKALINEFKEIREDFHKRMDIGKPLEEIRVSATAVKQNKKYLKQVIKLDKNFHLYIHAKTEYLEKGFDEERGLKYYKVFFVNEE